MDPGAHLFGRITGLVTALLAALFIPLASYASSLYAEALFVTLLVAGLTALNDAIERKSGRMAFGAGVTRRSSCCWAQCWSSDRGRGGIIWCTVA